MTSIERGSMCHIEFQKSGCHCDTCHVRANNFWYPNITIMWCSLLCMLCHGNIYGQWGFYMTWILYIFCIWWQSYLTIFVECVLDRFYWFCEISTNMMRIKHSISTLEVKSCRFDFVALFVFYKCMFNHAALPSVLMEDWML